MWKVFLFPVLGMVSILELSYPGYFSPSHQISKRVLTVTVGEASTAAAALSITGQVLLEVHIRFC